MNISANFKEYILKFKFPAKTSKNILIEKKTWFLFLKSDNNIGIGECSFVNHLSRKNEQQINQKLKEICNKINNNIELQEILNNLNDYPGIKFAIETAIIDLKTKGNKILFPSEFTEGKKGIKINGLIWIDNKDNVIKQIEKKLDEKYSCIKLKIGSMNLDEELEILSKIRKISFDVEIRLDANGAFNYTNALDIINYLKKFNIHSIEQPIPPGNFEAMQYLCKKSPIPIALDEELIFSTCNKQWLLDTIKPHYLVLKPGLLGGFNNTLEWIKLANERKINWWVTSALESNIGLNAISQWTFTLKNQLTQGLGTGQLYSNNISSPLFLKGEFLYFDQQQKWDLSNII